MERFCLVVLTDSVAAASTAGAGTVSFTAVRTVDRQPVKKNGKTTINVTKQRTATALNLCIFSSRHHLGRLIGRISKKD